MDAARPLGEILAVQIRLDAFGLQRQQWIVLLNDEARAYKNHSHGRDLAVCSEALCARHIRTQR